MQLLHDPNIQWWGTWIVFVAILKLIECLAEAVKMKRVPSKMLREALINGT